MAQKQRPKATKASRPTRDEALDQALVLADEIGWADFTLNQLAEREGWPLNDLRRHFADPNAVADAWFERALAAMLAPPPEGFADWPVRERLEFLLTRWLDALAPYRQVTADMIAGKWLPPHVHHWVPAIFHVSRKVQLWRDAARLYAGGRRRQIEEIGLTALFLATLAVWCRDTSPGQERSRRFLERWLSCADRTIARLYASGNKRVA